MTIKMEELVKHETIQRDLWKLSQIRKAIQVFKKGGYGDDEAIATVAALNDIIQLAKEDK